MFSKKNVPWNKGKKGVQVSWRKGKKFPELCGENNPFFGKTHSEETIKKIRLANLGKKHSEETKKKMSEAHKNDSRCGYWKGKKLSLETRKKMSEVRKGKPSPNKGEKRPNLSGKNAWNWKGGYIVHKGYVLLKRPNHPFCWSTGYIKRCRLVMEKYIGRYLTLNEVVHHINGIKDDDRIENLKLFPNGGEHSKFHSKLRRN